MSEGFSVISFVLGWIAFSIFMLPASAEAWTECKDSGGKPAIAFDWDVWECQHE